MSQIYVKANNDKHLQELRELLKNKKYDFKLASKEWRFMPIVIDTKLKTVRNITSATMCHCMFNIAKNPLINFNDFKTILSLTKEN